MRVDGSIDRSVDGWSTPSFLLFILFIFFYSPYHKSLPPSSTEAINKGAYCGRTDSPSPKCKVPPTTHGPWPHGPPTYFFPSLFDRACVIYIPLVVVDTDDADAFILPTMVQLLLFNQCLYDVWRTPLHLQSPTLLFIFIGSCEQMWTTNINQLRSNNLSSSLVLWCLCCWAGLVYQFCAADCFILLLVRSPCLRMTKCNCLTCLVPLFRTILPNKGNNYIIIL